MMKNIRVVYSKSKTLTSSLIKLIEGSKFSHVCIQYHCDTTGDLMVFEASHGDCHFIKFNHWINKNEVVAFNDLTLMPNEYEEMISLFNDKAQVKYGYMNLIGIAMHLVLGLPRNIFSDRGDSYICSELVAIFLERIMQYDLGMPIELIGPKYISEFLSDTKIVRFS